MAQLAQEAIRQILAEKKPKTPDDIMNALREMFREVLEEALVVEMEEHLGYEKSDMTGRQEIGATNSRNGYNRKTIKTELGPVEIAVPRDRNGEFEPELLPKHKRSVPGLEEKVLSLYAHGLSTRDIHDQISELYGVEISAETVSKITDRVLPLCQEWQNRLLESEYAFIFMDAVHYKVREEKRVVNKAAYVVLGVNMDGHKDILGIWIGAAETSRFWLGVLNDLKTRGVQKVHIFCVDGLNGFTEAIAATYPQARVQRCVIHQIRASMRYVGWKDRKAFAQDLKAIYTAVNEEEALRELAAVREKWASKYPNAVKSWERNWEELSTFFLYPEPLRRLIYTTNAIESVHYQFRKVTKSKGSFPTDESLLKMLYLAATRVSKKWTMRIRDWDLMLGQLQILDETVRAAVGSSSL